MAQDDKSKFRAGIHKAEANAGLAEAGTETLKEGMDAGAAAMSETMERTRQATGAAAQAMGEGLDKAADQAGRLTQQSLESVTAMSDAGRVMASHLQELSREMMAIAEDAMRHQMDGLTTLASCRTIPELMAAQAGFARQSMERFVDGQRRLAQATLRLADEARGQMTRLADGADPSRRAA